MKKLFLVLLCLASSRGFSSEKILTKIAHVDFPQGAEKDILIMAHTDGRVLRLAEKSELVKALLSAQKNQDTVELRINAEDKIESALSVETSSMMDLSTIDSTGPLDNYTPSVIASMDQVQSMFNGMRSNAGRRSQCFNRAHTWAWDWWSSSAISSSKVFLFYTRLYIRNVDSKWWFHVSPYLLVQTPQGIVERTMDRTFTDGPMGIHEWSQEFVLNHASCPVVGRYTDYENHQESQYCYLIKTSMYYWAPDDIENLDKEAKQKTQFIDWEVKAAYKQAYQGWF